MLSSLRAAGIAPHEAAILLLAAKLRVMGGPGSGNFGHAGRPGEVGGSGGGAGGIGTLTSGADSMTLSENKARIKELVDIYKSDPNFRGAADVVSHYAQLDQPTGLLTRGVVEATLAGKSADEIFADPKVQKLLANVNEHRNSDSQITRGDVEYLVAGASGYYATVRSIDPTDVVVYRGMKGSPKGEEFELRGPTAFSEHIDSAMTYSGGTLMEVEPGSKMLPVGAMSSVKSAAEGNEHATLPAFHKRSEQSIHPKGISYGYAIDFDSDRELNTAGRFRVISRGERRVGFTDGKSGKFRLKTVKVIRVKQIGVF